MTSLSSSSVPAGRTLRILFLAEMALSPLVASIALLVPVAANWGAYKYVPATVWLLILVQCLAIFRWRGLWFLLGLPVAFVAIETFLVAAPPFPERKVPTATIGFGGRLGAKLHSNT